VRTFCEKEGREILQMQTSTLSGTKILGFFDIYGVSARTRGEGIEPVRTSGSTPS